MRALVCTALGGIDALELQNRPAPVAGPGEVLIRVGAAGLNYPDLLMLTGSYQHKPAVPFVPGMEAAGEVIAVGPDMDQSWLGRRVMGGARGAFAEQAIVSVAEAMTIPADWSVEQAAAFPVIAKTAFHALVHRAHIRAGEWLVVHGASGGTGHMAIKIGKACGANVVATTSDPGKAEALRGFGADVVVDAMAPDLADHLKAVCGGRGADVVFDPVGGPLFDASLKAAAFGARLLIIGFVANAPNQVRTNYALIKGLSILGVRAGEAARNDPAIAASYRRDLPQLMTTADLRPHVSASFKLADGAAAFRRMQARGVIGKLVLTP